MVATASGSAGTQIGEPRLLIDGELTEAASGARFDNVNPAREVHIGMVDRYQVNDTYPWNGPHAIATDNYNGARFSTNSASLNSRRQTVSSFILVLGRVTKNAFASAIAVHQP